MRYTSKFAVEYDLEQHYLLREQYQNRCNELSCYEGYRLKEKDKRRDRSFYAMKRPTESRFSYAGDAASPEVQAIREYSYYKEVLKVIEDNIRVMEEFLEVYRQTRADSINDLLPKVYRLPRGDALLKLEPEVDRWLREMKDIKSKYPVFNPAGLTVTALDVFLMNPKIFEHLGNWFHKDMVKRRQYRTESIDRWDQFAQLGFYPEVNLLLTFGAGESFFDAQAIHRKIAMLAAPPPSEETMEMLRRM